MSKDSEISAVQCACGLRVERQYPQMPPTIHDLRSGGHDPEVCSKQVGYRSRLDGRADMLDICMEELVKRKTLKPPELGEIRTNLVAAMARTYPR